MEKRWLVIIGAAIIVGITFIPYSKLGSEFMPPLYEGDLLYMPTTLPGISVTKAKELLQQTDKIIKSFPEVESVFGKVGRAETATDPAPLSMIETTIQLKPESEWREGMTPDKLTEELNNAIQIPGLTNAWTMPIKTRIDMLSTGIKTPVGIKIAGPDLSILQDLGKEIEDVTRNIDGTRSAFAERSVGGNYIDLEIDRNAIARYGLTIEDVQNVFSSAVGGMNITKTVEGLERYPVNVRYQRDYRENIESLKRVIVPLPSGGRVLLSEIADIKIKKGPPMIKTENARPNVWVYVDLKQDIDVGTYIERAKDIINKEVSLPNGYSITWSGQYKYMERANERLSMLIPLTLLIVVVLLYFNTKSFTKTGIVLLALPFSMVGAIWFLYLAGYNMSVAVWVGIIALLGVDAETGVVMLLYLDIAYEKFKKKGMLTNLPALKEAIFEGAVKRIRPKVMTVMTTFLGLLPILVGMGIGSDVMKRIAAPMVGGIFTSMIMELTVYPAIFFALKKRELKKENLLTE
jgi:Cu(I)/Ag(I) efflux system membrane protein CusA/SilA